MAKKTTVVYASSIMNPLLPSGAGFGSVVGGSEGVTCGMGSYFFSTGLGLSTDSDLYSKSCQDVNKTTTVLLFLLGMFAKATSPEVVCCLCLWLRLVGSGLELVKVRQLLPVVVLVLVGVVVVGAHDVVGHAGGRLLRPRSSEVVERGRRSSGGGVDIDTTNTHTL